MRTLIKVENANCTFCMNDVRDTLLARPLVRDVRTSVVAGCWEVDHDHDDVAAITGVLRQSLHGWEVADNGEIVMIATSPDVADRCGEHPPGPSHSG